LSSSRPPREHPRRAADSCASTQPRPGDIRSPINRLGEPDEIAAAVLRLRSPGAGFVIGVALPVDGGYAAR
jgi:NAD(P)-dependent dehydrogenase (short-subunit alcohol dehydrogenase family)